MSNVLLAWDNAVSDGLVMYPWPSSYDATLDNLRTANLSEKWITTDDGTSSTRFDCTVAAGTGTTIALFALCNHNLSLAATVRITGSSDNWATTTYDSGTLPAYPTGTTEASRAGLRWNFWHRLSAPTARGRWRFQITDTSNPANFVSAGRLFAARSLWQPTVNMLAGAGLGWESNTELAKALNGGEWFVDAEAHRVAKFALQVPDSEMLASGFDLQRVAAGSNREVVWQYDPDDTVHSVRRSFMGRLRSLSAIEAPYHGTSKTAFEVKELL